MIVAKITWADGHQETIEKKDFMALAVWMEKHRGEYTEVDARMVKPDEIRQGKE